MRLFEHLLGRGHVGEADVEDDAILGEQVPGQQEQRERNGADQQAPRSCAAMQRQPAPARRSRDRSRRRRAASVPRGGRPRQSRGEAAGWRASPT